MDDYTIPTPTLPPLPVWTSYVLSISHFFFPGPLWNQTYPVPANPFFLRVISKTGQHYAFHLFRRATIPLPIRATLHPYRPSLADCFFSLRLSDGPLS
jgi:hypothetical protein